MYDTYTNLYSTNISTQYIIYARVRPWFLEAHN